MGIVEFAIVGILDRVWKVRAKVGLVMVFYCKLCGQRKVQQVEP